MLKILDSPSRGTLSNNRWSSEKDWTISGPWPMKLAFVSDRVFPYFKGGAERRYWEVAKYLVARGHEVHFYTGQWPSMPKNSVVDGINLHGVYRVGQFYVNGRKSITESIKYALCLLSHLLAGEYDLIDCEQFPLFPIFTAKLAAILRNKPLIVTWHEPWGCKAWVKYLGKIGLVGALIESIGIHLPDLIISVSRHTTDALVQMYGLTDLKMRTVCNGIDLSRMNVRASLGNRCDVVYVGRLIEHKKVEVLLEAISLVKERRPDIRCIIIGDGPRRTKLEDLTRHLRLENNVQFTGFVEDDYKVTSVVQASRVFVSPSIREGFGIAVLEANACGVPAVVTDHKDNASRNLIESGENGYVCSLDSKSFAASILRILSEPIGKYSAACRKQAQDFGWESVGEAIEQIYSEMLEFDGLRSLKARPGVSPSVQSQPQRTAG